MTQAIAGTTVSIHYAGTLADGTPFDSSTGRAPLSFEMGAGQVIPGLEAALEGMRAGESKTVTIPAEQAYGPRHEEAVQEVPRDAIPADIPLDLGMQLEVSTPDGRTLPVTVANVTETHVTLDANHRLAGQDLTFAVDVVEVSAD